MTSDEPLPPVTPPAEPDWESAARRWYRRVAAAFRFELARSLTPPRGVAWCVLALFPAAIMVGIGQRGALHEDQQWGMILYLLATQSTTILALLLWVAPAVQVELEGRTWTYLSVRPGGKLAVLCGKYLSGVVWAVSVGCCGLWLAVLVAFRHLDAPFEILRVLSLLQVLASLAYGSLFLAIGVLFPRRAMVVCVGFTLLFEVVLSLIPATVNQLTVQHRLLNLLWAGMADWEATGELELLLGSQPPVVHLVTLAVYTLVMLTLAGVGVQRREYLTSVEA